MSAEIALIGFPRLQEQIATRLLSEHDVHVQRVSHDEAAARLSMFNLALFFWPDGGDTAVQRLKDMRQKSAPNTCPVLLVTSHTGQNTAQGSVGTDAEGILLTPLQSHDVSQKLAQFAGISKSREKLSMDADYINPFVSATVDTLKQMASMACSRTGLKLSVEGTSQGYYTGTIGLSGKAEGFVSVTFTKELATKVVCKMLMCSGDEITEDDIRDGVGEFMNVVAGAAKAELVNTPHSFQLSVPQVFSGGPHFVAQPRGIPVFIIEFEAEKQKFEVLVCLRPKHS
ncbi:MAG: chemotaxis protein CheX [Calditrichaeota bacterium]|nr:chemotaxis protein CheX [Calditrichota bacterium]